MLADFTEEKLNPGLDIWFVGYPDNRFDSTNNLPLLRRGYISSIPKVDYNSQKQFIIDAQVFQGSSGSPVFAPIGNKYKLIGVVSATMIKHGQLQTIPTLQNGLGVQQILGLGIVIKSTTIVELITEVKRKYFESLPITTD
jgi:S1-C subfamily serine protease